MTSNNNSNANAIRSNTVPYRGNHIRTADAVQMILNQQAPGSIFYGGENRRQFSGEELERLAASRFLSVSRAAKQEINRRAKKRKAKRKAKQTSKSAAKTTTSSTHTLRHSVAKTKPTTPAKPKRKTKTTRKRKSTPAKQAKPAPKQPATPKYDNVFDEMLAAIEAL